MRANHKQKSSVKDNTSHPVWDPDGKMPFVFAVRRMATTLMIGIRLVISGQGKGFSQRAQTSTGLCELRAASCMAS